MLKDKFINSLAYILDNKDIKIDKVSKSIYSKDWSTIEPSEPIAITFPREERQLIELVKLCNKYNQAFIGSGGRTGLSGGATALDNELIISFEKMNKIIDFDSNDNTVLVQPGFVTQQLQEFANDNNLFYPIEFSSSGSSQIGGNIATNSGGIRVIKYGLTKNYVQGLEVIGGDGEKYNYDKRLIKNATGPDPKNFFIGSEGVFGLFSLCRMKLIEKPNETKVALIGFNEINKLNYIRSLLLAHNNIEALEFYTQISSQQVHEIFKTKNPLDAKANYFLIIEYSDTVIEKTLEKMLVSNHINDAIISQNINDKEMLWKTRMQISESITNLRPLKFDIAVPINNFSLLVNKIEEFDKNLSSINSILFGHIGDGNLHANFISSDSSKINKNLIRDINNFIYQLVIDLKGTISAEHGIGCLKRSMLKKFYSKKEIEVLKNMKKSYDPNNLLNPGKLVY